MLFTLKMAPLKRSSVGAKPLTKREQVKDAGVKKFRVGKKAVPPERPNPNGRSAMMRWLGDA